jgi:acetyl-CoA carboxylase carboxyltransferase component
LTEHPTEKNVKRPGGILYREGIAKISQFSRTCDADGIPIVWLQDISGFDIGVEAERQGLLGYGSNLIYTNSTNRVPMFTVLLRKASGAGYYAMAGLPYRPIVQLATPITRLSVMEGRTLAIGAFRTKLDEQFNVVAETKKEREKIQREMQQVEQRIERDMDPIQAAARRDLDEVVKPSELRLYLDALISMAYQASGYRRVKNPRIWAMHDLDVLTR